jgi:hypothetical protein
MRAGWRVGWGASERASTINTMSVGLFRHQNRGRRVSPAAIHDGPRAALKLPAVFLFVPLLRRNPIR